MHDDLWLISDYIHIFLQATNQVLIEYYNLVCEGPNSLYWIILLLAYLFLAQMVAVVLAFRTRKVTIKALNDSKQLTVIIYLSTVIITVMIISAAVLSRFLNTDAAVFGGLIMFFTTLVLGLMFIPKVRIKLCCLYNLFLFCYYIVFYAKVIQLY